MRTFDADLGEVSFAAFNPLLPQGEEWDPLTRAGYLTANHGELYAIGRYGYYLLFDASSGENRGALSCYELLDDGERLWCGTGERPEAYSYEGELLYTTEDAMRLVSGFSDPRFSETSVPVFVDQNGVVTAVDLATGRTIGTVDLDANPFTFDHQIEPVAWNTESGAFIGYMERFALLSEDGHTVLWERDDLRFDRNIWAVDGSFAWSSISRVIILDGETGETVSEYPSEGFPDLEGDGEYIFQIRDDVIRRVELP